MRVSTLPLLLAVALPAALAAQARVVGVARDSLTDRPFAGATVQLVPAATPWATGRTVTADAGGRFDIPDVAPGRYLLGFVHRRLDSLDMEPPTRTLDVTARSGELVADLALPSARTIARSLCGTRRDGTGVLLGRVLDADRNQAVAAGSVFVRWAEIRIDAGGVHTVRQSVLAKVGEGSRYAVCGVPTDVPVLVQAAGRVPPDTTATSGEVELAFAPATPLLHRDLLVRAARPDRGSTAASAGGAPGAGTARLTGRVIRPDGRPASGARVVVRDMRAADSSAVSSADGTFRLEALPGGTYAVEVVAVGFTPARAAVDLLPGRAAALDLVLGAPVGALRPISVYARTPGAASEFAHRRRQSVGRYVSAEDIERRGARTYAEALRTVPELRVTGQSPRGRPEIRGRGLCTPAFYLNGMPILDSASDLDDLMPITQVAGIEVFDGPAERPLQHDHGPCATVLVWTKGARR